jgi:hypothetical protein
MRHARESGRVSFHVEGEGGNREISPLFFSDARGDLSRAWVGACVKEEGGLRRKHGFPRASEPKASEVAAA